MSHTNSKTIELQTADVFSTILKTVSVHEWKNCLPRLQLNFVDPEHHPSSEVVTVIKEFSEKNRYSWLHPEDFLDEVFTDAGLRLGKELGSTALTAPINSQPIRRVFYAQVGYYLNPEVTLAVWGLDFLNNKISTIVAPIEKVSMTDTTNSSTNIKKFLRIKKDWEQLDTQRLTEESLSLFPLRPFLIAANLSLLSNLK